MSRRFPNLFIIGAMKSGTTTLHDTLGQHPEIFMAAFKEPQYFVRPPMADYHWFLDEDRPDDEGRWYFRLFEPAEADPAVRYAGESSTSYTKRPEWEGAADRIHAHNPGSRIIYIMRDPIDRAISHYWHNVRTRDERRPMTVAFRDDPYFVAFSDYALQLEPFLDRFPAEQIRLMTLERYTADPGGELRALLEWLGVEAGPLDRLGESRSNVAPDEVPRVRPGMTWLSRMRRTNRWKRAERRLPRLVGKALNRATYGRMNRKAMEHERRESVAYLRPILHERLPRLCELTGRSFPEWTTLQPEAGGVPG